MDKIEFNFFKGLQDWMGAQSPVKLLHVHAKNGWLRSHLPEVHALYGVPQSPQWHPEVDTGVHVELSLQQATLLTPDRAVRFAVLLHDLGKGLTPVGMLPKHHNHEAAGLPLVERVCVRFEVSADWRELALLVCGYHLHVHRALDLSARGVVRFFRETGLYQNPALLDPLLLACLADARGRAGMENKPYPQMAFLQAALAATLHLVDDSDPNQTNHLRVSAVRKLRTQYLT